jgi:hypothetical protein
MVYKKKGPVVKELIFGVSPYTISIVVKMTALANPTRIVA